MLLEADLALCLLERFLFMEFFYYYVIIECVFAVEDWVCLLA